MRVPSGYSREKLFSKISTYLNTRSEISFAYVFSPLANTEYRALTDFDVAVQLPVYYTRHAVQEKKRHLTGGLSLFLPTDNFTIVAFNDCPEPFQKIILQTGTLVFNRHPQAHSCYLAFMMRRNPDLVAVLEKSSTAVR